MATRAETGNITYWLLGALLLALMTIFGITHSMLLDTIGSLERRIERLENKTMNMPVQEKETP